MARPFTETVKHRFIELWTGRLRELELVDGAWGVEQLVALLGLQTPVPPNLRKILRQVLVELRKALGDGCAPPELEAWVERHLLLPHSASLIWPEKARRLALAQVRDGLKRSEKTEAGQRSSRITLPASAWRRLKAIQHASGLTTRAEALEHVIAAHSLQKKSVSQGGSRRSKHQAKLKAPGANDPQGKLHLRDDT
jgi:hypothetical protein